MGRELAAVDRRHSGLECRWSERTATHRESLSRRSSPRAALGAPGFLAGILLVLGSCGTPAPPCGFESDMTDSGETASASLGFAVALDDEVLVTGATADHNVDELATGALYVYERENETWSQTQKLTVSDAQQDDLLGAAVDVDGAVLVAGAPGREGSRGIAYVFEKPGEAWQQSQILDADEERGPNDFFGASVAVASDVIAVGALGHSGLQGAVFVYEQRGTEWILAATLRGESPAGLFGISVATDGQTLLVGAPEDESNGVKVGAAYVFQRGESTWSQTQRLVAPDGAQDDLFGQSVSFDNGFLAVGAPLADDQGIDTGAAHIFELRGEEWQHSAELLPANGSESGQFGFSVAARRKAVAVGAPQDRDIGSAYVFDYFQGSWRLTQKLEPIAGMPQDFFGVDVAVSVGDLVIGSSDDDNDSNENVGSIATFERQYGSRCHLELESLQ